MFSTPPHLRVLTVVATLLVAKSLQAADPPPAREPVPQAERDKLVARAKERARRDTKKYSREQLQEAEQLYQVANKNWRTVEAKVSLEKMVQKYPDINRTGCAVLYLAQYSRGEAREKLQDRNKCTDTPTPTTKGPHNTATPQHKLPNVWLRSP